MGTLREPWGTLGTLGTLREPWEPWEPLLGNLGTFTWDPGNLYLGTFTWEPGNLYLGPWEPLLGKLYLGTFTWEPGNLYLEPGNLGGMGFGAAPVCSETFTMAEDPKAFCCWGINGTGLQPHPLRHGHGSSPAHGLLSPLPPCGNRGVSWSSSIFVSLYLCIYVCMYVGRYVCMYVGM